MNVSSFLHGEREDDTKWIGLWCSFYGDIIPGQVLAVSTALACGLYESQLLS